MLTTQAIATSVNPTTTTTLADGESRGQGQIQGQGQGHKRSIDVDKQSVFSEDGTVSDRGEECQVLFSVTA